MAFLAVEQARLPGKRRLDGVGTDAIDRLHDSNLRFDRAQAMPGPANSIIVKNVPRSTNADVWDEWADEDEDDDFLSPEMRERLKALDAETAPPVDKCPIQHDLGDDDALKCSKDWVNAIVSDAGICPFSLSADRAGLPLGDVRYDVTRADDTETCFQWSIAVWKSTRDRHRARHPQVLEGSPMARGPPSTRDVAAPNDKPLLGQ